MAQKKGGGSTRNGRDSKPKMLGVKVVNLSLLAQSLCVNVVPSFTLATMSASALITLCLHLKTVTCRLLSKVR